VGWKIGLLKDVADKLKIDIAHFPQVSTKIQ